MTVKFHGDATAVEQLVKRLRDKHVVGVLHYPVEEAASCIEALQAEIAGHKTDIKQLQDLANAHGDEWNLAEQRAKALADAVREYWAGDWEDRSAMFDALAAYDKASK